MSKKSGSRWKWLLGGAAVAGGGYAISQLASERQQGMAHGGASGTTRAGAEHDFTVDTTDYTGNLYRDKEGLVWLLVPEPPSDVTPEEAQQSGGIPGEPMYQALGPDGQWWPKLERARMLNFLWYYGWKFLKKQKPPLPPMRPYRRGRGGFHTPGPYSASTTNVTL